MKKSRALMMISGILLAAGLIMVFGIAGTDQMMFEIGQAGPPLGELIWKGLVGAGAMAAGVAGMNYSYAR